jgi:hypothetical protein
LRQESQNKRDSDAYLNSTHTLTSTCTVGSILTRVISQFSRLGRLSEFYAYTYEYVYCAWYCRQYFNTCYFSVLTTYSIALASCCCLVKKIVS